MNMQGARMPSPDGLRAISIYGHLCGTRHSPVPIAAYGRWCGDVAHLGVLVFFVISGFLITLLLMGEREATGAISLKRFYLRWMLRIFPAFYAFVLVMAIATAALAVPLVLLINRIGSRPVAILLGSPLMKLCLAVLIESGTRHVDSLAGRLSNWKPVVFLGVLSYSLYLWQMPFLDHRSDAWIHAFPQNLMLVFLAALSSWFLIERPFNRLRRRLRHGNELPAIVQRQHQCRTATSPLR